MELVCSLMIGTVGMFAVMLVCRRWYSLSMGKTVLTTMLLVLSGVVSVKIMFFIENGGLGGLSFFGAVLFVPIFWILVARSLRLPYKESLDMVAPSICIMLAVMKVNCMRGGCCGGRFLYVTGDKVPVYFPSRQVECANAIILMLVLLYLMKKGKYRERIYPVFMILYGITRFILNWFRYTSTPFLWGIPAGNIWAVVSLGVGILWILVERRKSKQGGVT